MFRIPYIRHWVHRSVARLRHSRISNAWFDYEADRLGKTREEIAGMLLTMTAAQISALPADGGGGEQGENTLTFTAGVIVNDAIPEDPQYDWGFVSPSMVPPLPQAIGTQTGGSDGKVFMITLGQQGPIGSPVDGTKRLSFGANGAADDGLTSVVITTPAGTYTFAPEWQDGGSLAFWSFNVYNGPTLPALLEGQSFTVELVYS